MFGGHWPLVPIGHTLPCPTTGQSPLTHTAMGDPKMETLYSLVVSILVIT